MTVSVWFEMLIVGDIFMKELSFTELHIMAETDNRHSQSLQSAVRMLQLGKPVYIYHFDNNTIAISDHPVSHAISLF